MQRHALHWQRFIFDVLVALHLRQVGTLAPSHQPCETVVFVCEELCASMTLCGAQPESRMLSFELLGTSNLHLSFVRTVLKLWLFP